MLNKIMLITYPDSMGHDLKNLHHILNLYFKDAVKMVHILPFFPSSGDRGFAPLGYEKVSEEFGNWGDVRMLSEEYPLMFDYMINHISAHSPYYQDFLENKDQSPYRGLFIRYKDFWKNGMPSQAETDAIYKRKPRAPYVMAEFADQTQEAVWCTFERNRLTLTWKQRKENAFWKKIFAGWLDTVHLLSVWMLLPML